MGKFHHDAQVSGAGPRNRVRKGKWGKTHVIPSKSSRGTLCNPGKERMGEKKESEFIDPVTPSQKKTLIQLRTKLPKSGNEQGKWTFRHREGTEGNSDGLQKHTSRDEVRHYFEKIQILLT